MPGTSVQVQGALRGLVRLHCTSSEKCLVSLQCGRTQGPERDSPLLEGYIKEVLLGTKCPWLGFFPDSSLARSVCALACHNAALSASDLDGSDKREDCKHASATEPLE